MIAHWVATSLRKWKAPKPSIEEVNMSKKFETNKLTNVRVSNISDISGDLKVADGNMSTHQTTTGLRAAEIKKLFD